MGILRRQTKTPSVAAARTLPVGVGNIGTGALTLAGITPDPFSSSPVTRAQALSWPALNNGLRVYTNMRMQLPLGAKSPLGVSDDTTQFLATLDPAMPPGWTNAKTVESIVCHAAADWLITERYATGFPRYVEYVDQEIIQPQMARSTNGIEKVDHYRVGSEKWDPKDVIHFTGVLPGILSTGAASIRTALANLHATRMYAENPSTHITLHDTEGAEVLETDDAVLYLEALRDAVMSHGNAYLGGLTAVTHSWSAKDIQLVEARHADAVEAARLLALPTYYVAAPNQGSSLTYSNQVDVRRDVISALASFAGVIEGRLSLPDVTPRGTKVSFDAASFYAQVTPTASENTTTTQTPPSEPGTNL